jgi:hypothetical protein
MVGHGQDRTEMRCRGTGCLRLVVRLSQSGVAMLGIRAGLPLRDGVVAAYVQQIDRHQKENRGRDSDDPKQTATHGPSVESLPDFEPGAASVESEFDDCAARAPGMGALIPQAPALEHVATRIVDSTIPPRESHPSLDNRCETAPHIHRIGGGHPRYQPVRRLYMAGSRPSRPPHIQ